MCSNLTGNWLKDISDDKLYVRQTTATRDSNTPFTRHNRLSNRFDNRLDVCTVCTRDTTCCPTGCQTGLTTGLTTGCTVHTNIQPVVKRVSQPVWQQIISCKRSSKGVARRDWAAPARWRTISQQVQRIRQSMKPEMSKASIDAV